MTTETAVQTQKPFLRSNLERRFRDAVLAAARRVAQLEAETLTVREQSRHRDRMISVQLTMTGSGWMGSLVLLIPAAGAGVVASRIRGEVSSVARGPELSDALGELAAGIGLEFGRSFADEDSVTVGMPAVIGGNDLTVSFPWGNHFESRLAFKSDTTPFWAILRLSRTAS